MAGIKMIAKAAFLLAVMTMAGLPFASAMARDVSLVPDKAKILRLERPAATIIIGNPAIADATIRSGSMMILTGKSYGNTNLIALDATGEEIANINLTVAPPEYQTLWLYKGVDHASYNCNPRCARVLAIGDEKGSFNHIDEQTRKRTGLASGESGTSSGAPPQ